MTSEEQAIVGQFLGENPDAAQLHQWRLTLTARARRLRKELEGASEAQASALRARLAEMDRQIAALEQEEMISAFVEGEVRYTLAMGAIIEGQHLEE